MVRWIALPGRATQQDEPLARLASQQEMSHSACETPPDVCCKGRRAPEIKDPESFE
jgi:hypothetical protein